LRTVYLGTSPFAAAVLRALADSPHRPAMVLTRPDAPAGRGRRLTPPPIVPVAAELGLGVLQPESVNTSVEQIAAAEPEALVVCAFGALIKEPLLSAWPIFNVHPSLLPRWRGAAPIERAIMAGDPETGVAIMQLTAGLDSGPVYDVARAPISDEDDYGSLSSRLQELAGELLVSVLDAPAEPAEQSEAGATYAEKISAADRRLDPTAEPADVLARRVRALHPHIGAFMEEPRLGIQQARVVSSPGLPAGGLDLSGPLPVLACLDGGLELLRVQPPGKKPMSGADYLRGLRR
jgi:methionyl-tRNA formyltransferase